MPQPDAARFVVVVARSGGIAGMTREWRAEADARADAAAAEHWRTLVEECPWDSAGEPTPGADRFQWRIEVRVDDETRRQVRMGDGQIAGPWRTLVDEVRSAASPSSPSRASR